MATQEKNPAIAANNQTGEEQRANNNIPHLANATWILEATLSYARRGWHVIPLHTPVNGRCSCGKTDCQHIGKHPRTMNGLKDASTDEATIKEWWTAWPSANIGLVAGEGSGIAVLDIDTDKGGEDSWADLLDEYGVYPETVEAITGGGGRHIIFKHPGCFVKSINGFRPGLDSKADGGYIVAPPSLHKSGRRYQWEVSSHPDDIPLADMPTWLIEILNGPGKNSTVEPIPEFIPEGKRNNTLTSLAGSMRHRRASQRAIEAALLIENKERCTPPLSDAEVKQIAESVSKYSPGEASSPSQSLRGCDAVPVKIHRLCDVEEPPPMRFIVDDFIPVDYPTLLYGDGGQGKSYIALYLACCVAIGRYFLDKHVQEGNVLFVDFELDEAEQARRAYKVSRGLGLATPPEGLLYYSPLSQDKKAGDLNSIIDSLVSFIKDHDIVLTIVDSFGAAVSGDPESARDVTTLYRKLRPLGTVLILDHQSKPKAGEKYRDKTAFGSVYKQNMSRNIWQLQRMIDSGIQENEIKLALHHNKSNFGPLRESTFLKATFGESFTLEQIKADIYFTEALTTKDHILISFTEHGPCTAENVSEVTGIPLGTVKNNVTKLKKEGKLAPTGEKRDKADVYKSIVTPSQPYRGWDSDDANSGDSSQVISDGDSDKPQAPKKWPCPQCGEIVEKFYGIEPDIMCRDCTAKKKLDAPRLELSD